MDKYDTLEYSWVKATVVSLCLRIYLCAFKNTNKLSSAVARETIGVEILIVILMSTNLVVTSFCGITPVLLNCGKGRTLDAIATFRWVSTRKEETLKNPGCLNIQDPSSQEPYHLTGLYRHIYIILTMCILEKRSPSQEFKSHPKWRTKMLHYSQIPSCESW